MNAPMDCRCNAEKVGAVHAYLQEHFPRHALDDFHTTSRLLQQGTAPGNADQHVVRITAAEEQTYHAILLSEFLERPLNEITHCLQDWHLVATLRGLRIAVVGRDGLSAL